MSVTNASKKKPKTFVCVCCKQRLKIARQGAWPGYCDWCAGNR